LLEDVFTVRRMDWGLRDEVVGGPRETVAMETFSDAVRRGRDDEILSDAASVIASAALTAAERWLRRDDMMDEGTATKVQVA